MSKRFVIANDQIYDMYSLSNTDLHIKDGCLYRLDRCIGVIYEELDIIELKAKAFDLLKLYLKIFDFGDDYILLALQNEDGHTFYKPSKERLELIKQALEVE